MATDLAPIKQAPAAKYDAFVEAQLTRARSRIRSLDTTSAILGFLAVSMAYGLIMALCDRWWEFSPLARQLGLGLYVVGAIAFLVLGLILPLFRRINPYYAARKVERFLPGAKNSVVNWLDLHTEPRPPAIRGALSQRAARDLTQTDLEQAISGQRALWAGGATGGVALASLVALILLGPPQIFSLLSRAFAPFTSG